MSGKRRASRGADQAGIEDAGVPSYFIYGFEERAFDDRLLHFERIEEQLANHDWNARAHIHKGLHQLMFFECGGGRILLEDDWHDFRAPLLFVVPPGIVHGFQFERDTAGPIVTISEDFMNEALSFADSGIAAAVSRPAIILLDAEAVEHHGLPGIFQSMERDFRWIAPARSTALMASLVLLLVAVSRLAVTADHTSPNSTAYFEKYEAFRKHVEQVFRQQPSVAAVAGELGLTVGRLTSICRTVAGVSPQQLMHQRLITEAKRQLLYSPHSATSISYMLGFRDPAYFSRFFKRATGESPVEFRKRAQATTLSSW